jgi:serine/threonine protein kinase
VEHRILKNLLYSLKSKMKISDFELGFSLGKGKFAVVKSAMEKRSKRVVALKMIDRKKIAGIESQLKREIEIQYNLR